ncbi:MAG TPA: DUF1175 family protein [Acidisarcina sp.]
MVLVAFVIAALLSLWWRHGTRPHLNLSTQEVTLLADGRLHRAAELRLSGKRALPLDDVRLEGLPSRVVVAKDGAAGNGATLVEVYAPVNPETHRIMLSYRNAHASILLHFAPDADDRFGDGTPDFLRLHSASDRLAFRGWFTALADTAAALAAEKLPREIDDCAALLRWCYRGALHAHDEAWQSMMPLDTLPPIPSVVQYAYPFTPLGASLFRVHPGVYQAADRGNGNFAQFADAKTLWQQNTFFLSRNVAAARPGDLLFFRQLEQNSPYHSMILTGAAHAWAVYHTGPTAHGLGEVRRVALADLLRHPDSRWRPIPQNSNFLGVYRWNILREDPR